jgi:hypothetical protein
MQDRDSFYNRAIRTKLRETTGANVPPADGKAQKAFDLDDPEQRRRFMESEKETGRR